MKPLTLLAAAVLTTFAVSAQAAGPVKSCCTSCETKSSKAAKMTPAEFATFLANVNYTEIKLGQVAQTNAASPAVKKFGAYMVKSHTKLNKELKDVAAKSNIPVPYSYDQKSAAIVAKLSALHGSAFDNTYIPAMVAGHTKVLAMVKCFESCTKDPAFKKLAARTAPVVAKHLQMAQEVKAKL